MRGRPVRRGSGEQAAGGVSGSAGSSATSCETRQAILRAARERFVHYGYKKTTIDEIAAAAGVGKGTVYLYFDSKEEIMLTLARELKRNVTDQMRAIANSLVGPEEKLRRMILARVFAVHDAINATAHGVELVDEMMRPKVMECGMCEHEIQQALLAGVLREGASEGRFTLLAEDEMHTALLFSRAFLSFQPPYVNHCLAGTSCPKELERQVGEMAEFILAGLRRRA
ncbi:MAG TPA: helix-turn-helix domain-containing protein [Armatimonadaceae bacterium]|nr:helix-turn-helix domain-containing protein [Armatimonadaceae bacterium]